jgi:hypothetical protein
MTSPQEEVGAELYCYPLFPSLSDRDLNLDRHLNFNLKGTIALLPPSYRIDSIPFHRKIDK